MYLPETTHISPLTTLRRDRMLPVPGEVAVAIDQRVEAVEVVARAALQPKHRILNVAREFGLLPEAADRHLVRKAGDMVQAGEVLAQRRGWGRRAIHSPVDGRVVAAGGGQILLQAVTEPFELRALIPGIVVNQIQEQGVTIETVGALVQAAWGNGRQDYGVMRVLTEQASEPLTTGHIDVSQRGAVLAAGLLTDAAALRLAIDIQLRGLILGSMPAHLHAAAMKAPFPVLLIEGWGERPMCEPAFQLLRTNSGREAALDGTPADRYRGTRPEVIIPLPAAGAMRPAVPVEAEGFSVGQRVRVTRAPHAGAVGILTQLSERAQTFPSGLRAPAARVELESAGNVWVPFPNLEILE